MVWFILEGRNQAGLGQQFGKAHPQRVLCAASSCSGFLLGKLASLQQVQHRLLPSHRCAPHWALCRTAKQSSQ